MQLPYFCSFHVTCRTTSVTFIREICSNTTRNFVQILKKLLINKFLATTLPASTNVLLLALLDFHRQKTMTHISPFSNNIRSQIHLLTLPEHFSLCSFPTHSPRIPLHAAPRNITGDFPPGWFCKKTLYISPLFAHFHPFLYNAFQNPFLFPLLPNIISIFYPHSVTHLTYSKEPIALPPSAICVRISLKVFPSYLSFSNRYPRYHSCFSLINTL